MSESQDVSYTTLLYEKSGRVIRISLNRPDKRNALSDLMLNELLLAFERADADRDAGCVVLTGVGDQAFCAGADLGGFGGGDSGILGQYESRGLFPELFLRMESLSKPILAAVNGTCVAGGFGLMMACDLAVAKAGVKLGTPEIARGLFPFMISALITRAVPRRRAMELMFMGELFLAEQAESWNIVNRVVPAESFQAEVDRYAQRIASYSPAVLRLGKHALAKKEGMGLEGQLTFLQGLLSMNVMMEDAAEGISAFFDKRDPVWKGR